MIPRTLSKWLKGHPLMGWYIALIVTLDFLIHLLERHII